MPVSTWFQPADEDKVEAVQGSQDLVGRTQGQHDGGGAQANGRPEEAH